MGLAGINIWQLLIILLIVILIFGTKRLKTLGGDLGGALKSFRKAMDNSHDDDKDGSKDGGEAPRIESSKGPDAEFDEQREDKKEQNTR